MQIIERQAAATVDLENDQPRNSCEDKHYVWYACYGSNLCYDRFMEYINECTDKDKTPPAKWHSITINHELYFARESKRWDCKAVAFIDPEINDNAKTLGRMYYITEAQYIKIKFKEGPKYTNEIELGEYEGNRIVTFTDKRLYEKRLPSMKYIECLVKGLQETYPNMSEAEIYKYLMNVILN